MSNPAILALADGTVFVGTSIGAEGHSVGEVVFNTAMTGYQEILTDPSYAKQLVTLTYPHIGNTGTNSEDHESGRDQIVWAAGLIIRELSPMASSFRSEQSLSEYLADQNVVAIADIDTRRLTRHLRNHGAQNGCLMSTTAENLEADTNKALQMAAEFTGLKGMDLAKECCDKDGFEWTTGSWKLDISKYDSSKTGTGFLSLGAGIEEKHHVVAYDFGVKTNILRLLVDRGCKVTCVPAQTPMDQVLAMNPDGIFLSNGPGDPEPCTYAVDAIKQALTTDVPIFGICLGHQLLATAAGAKTLKMKFGHHGANHPVQDTRTAQVMITSQNHGFAVDESTLPANVAVTHRSLFDGSNQGIELTDKPAFSFQGHPEASPGPEDAQALFDHFIELIEARKSA